MGTFAPIPEQLRPAPTPVDPLAEFGRISEIKSMMQQQQLQGQDIQTKQLQNQQLARESQDDQKWRSVMSDPQWDGTPEGMLKMGLQRGVGPKSYLGMQNAFIEQRKNFAAYTKDNLDNMAKTGDMYRGQLSSLIQGPDTAKQDAWTQVLQAGRKDPIEASTFNQMPDQYPGDTAAQSFANHLALGSVLAKEASDAKNAGARAQGSQTGANRLAGEQDPTNPLYSPTPAYLDSQAAQGNPGATTILSGQAKQAGAVAGAQAAAKQPYEMQLEQVRQNVAQQLSTNKDARDKIEGSVLKPYEDKMSSISELQSAVQQASNGNVAAARGVLLKLMGVTNPDGTKRYNEAEASRMLSMGSVPQRLAGSVKNLLTGDNWTPQMASDISSFASAQGQVAQTNLSRGIANVNQLYQTNVGSGLIPGGGRAPSFAEWKRAQPQ